jgi:hypothetical protein
MDNWHKWVLIKTNGELTQMGSNKNKWVLIKTNGQLTQTGSNKNKWTTDTNGF